MTTPSQSLQEEIRSRVEAIVASDPATAGPLWGAIHKVLLKAKVDPVALARAVTSRDVAALQRLVLALCGASAASDEGPCRGDGPERAAVGAAGGSEEGPKGPTPTIPQEVLDSALRAFRKRLKLTRLDHESKLSVRPLTSGRKHEVDAIIPPREFPTAVWEALVAAGRLDRAGQGFYALAEER